MSKLKPDHDAGYRQKGPDGKEAEVTVNFHSQWNVTAVKSGRYE